MHSRPVPRRSLRPSVAGRYAFDGVRIVGDDAIVAGADGLADLAEPDLSPLDDSGDVADADRRAVLGLDEGVGDVVGIGEEADRADVDLPAGPLR